MPLSRSALYYRTHPEAAKKHRKYNIERNKSKKQTAYRVELNKERRSRGIYGKGGPDMSHTESGKLVEEDPSKNRARNGADGNNSKRKDSLRPRKGKKCGESFIPHTHKCNLTAGSVARTTQKAAILGAGVALGAFAAVRARSLWTPALNRLYTEARKANKPWDTYAKKLKEDLIDPNVARLAQKRKALNKRICSRGDSRQDAWSACKFAIGEPSQYGRVIKHPTQPFVFKVPKEAHYVPTSNGVKMTGTKKLRSKVADMFDKEAGNLQYANRIRVDSPRLEGYNPNTRTIAMEFLEGYDTYRSLRGKYPRLDQSVQFQVFCNLRKMHVNGLVHNDLHAGNILVNPLNKKIALIDFGHALKKKDLAFEDYVYSVYDEIKTASIITLDLPYPKMRSIENKLDDFAKNLMPNFAEEDYNTGIEELYQYIAVTLLN